jgi:hypothetical protein
MQLERICARVLESYRATFDWTPGVGRDDCRALHGKQFQARAMSRIF